MRISKIILSNYRQFKNIEINFDKNYENDLYIIIGKNGSGKTNVLNALNWCLYNDEPHLSKDSQQLSIVNLKSIEEAEEEEDISVQAEIWVDISENKYCIFTRKSTYRISKNEKAEKHPKRQQIEFEVKYIDDKGNTNIIKNDEADFYVERFVPKAIREFYFFDGERLDNYFKDATADRIRHTITLVSQVDLLEDKIEKRLSDILRELRKEVGKENPNINEINIILEKKESEHNLLEEQINKCKDQINISKKRIEGYIEKTRGIPDVDHLNNELQELKRSKKHEKTTLDIKIKEKQDLLFEYGKNIMLWPAIEKSIQIIKEKRDKKEIPPLINENIIEEILKNEVCNICGRQLDNESKEKVKSLLEEVKLSSYKLTQLSNMETPLYLIKEEIKEFSKKNNSVTQDIKNYDKSLQNIEEKIEEIEKKLSSYDSIKVSEWFKDKKTTEEICEDNQKKLGSLEQTNKELLKAIEDLNNQWKEGIGKVNKIEQVKKQIDFCTKSLDIVIKTKEMIREKTREKIEIETNSNFFKLLWKKRTFKDINISKDYNINLIHSMGYECLGTVGAAERELLALSFTLALHTISGFDAPILVDTPVGRVADEHRENLGKIFLEVSKKKQLILLFTSAEYSKEISKILESENINKFNFRLSEDEKETILEGK